MQASLKSEPMEVSQRMREEGSLLPSGLKNVGNTCYFNSLLQALFFLPNINKKLLLSKVQMAQVPGRSAPMEEQRKYASQAMVLNVRKLFATLILTN